MRRYIWPVVWRTTAAVLLVELLHPFWVDRLNLGEPWLIALTVVAANYALPALAKRLRRT